MIQEKEIARPAGGTAERAAMEMTACRASIPVFKFNIGKSYRQDYTNICMCNKIVGKGGWHQNQSQ